LSESEVTQMKDRIMSNAKMSDMEKLKQIFDIDKEKLKKDFPQLYYAILAVLDKEKKMDASGYFNNLTEE
jgi:hypothetical protein